MSKIGVLFCSYGNIEYVADSLATWQRAQVDKLGGNKYVISAVSLPFDQYKNIQNNNNDGTTEFLIEEYNAHKIDYLAIEPEYISEAEARNLALKPLLEAKCDYVWIFDGDEIITEEQIEKVSNLIEVSRWESWFSLSYKNYVFDKHSYLTEPFSPPRIFRVHTNGFQIDHFYYDNDIKYKRELVFSGSPLPLEISYKELPNKTIPSNICFCRHYTWLNNDKSHQKILYQNSRGWLCSFRWDDKEGLKFNEEFYLKNGLMLPEISQD